MRFNRLLRAALLIGAFVDLAFGAAALIAWRWLLNLLRVPLPTNPSFVKLAAVLSLGMALMIFVAWRAPGRSLGNITVAVLVRFGMALLLAWLVSGGELPRNIAWLAAGEGLLGILHLLYARRLSKE